MTTCAECLSALSTTRLSEIQPGSEVALHYSTCPHCLQVAQETRYAEYRLATTLNEQRSATDPAVLAAAAIDGSEKLRRKRVAQWLRGALVVAGLVIFGTYMEENARGPGSREQRIVTETIQLTCLSPVQAAELATPYLRSNGSAVYRQDALHSITLRGRVKEFRAARMEIERFDSKEACAVPPATTPSPSAEKPGKD